MSKQPDDRAAEVVLNKVREYLAEHGPTLGVDLVAATGMDILPLATLLGTADDMCRAAIEKNYLRIDPSSPEQARISPSFLRKFISFTMFGLDAEATQAAIDALKASHRTISARKRQLAEELCLQVFPLILPDIDGDIGVFLCGDVVFDLAHDSRRLEHSTGLPVRGSDIDIVVVLEDRDIGVRPDIERELLSKKYLWLKHPDIREELDFVVKSVSELERQLNFETTKDLIASKIIIESRPLWGLGDMNSAVQRLIDTSGVKTRLAEMETAARARQVAFEDRVYSGEISALQDSNRFLYYSAELNELGEFVGSRNSLMEMDI